MTPRRTPGFGGFPQKTPVLALVLLVLLAGCGNEGAKPAPPPPIGQQLELERDYRREVLAAGEPKAYRFNAPHRGAYLVMVSDARKKVELTIASPRKTCFIQGNGSCELISSPGEILGFEILAPEGEFLSFTLTVSFTEGTGRLEGSVAIPVDLVLGKEREGRVGLHETSYYRFKTSTGGKYAIRLEKARGDLAWRLFDRKHFDVILKDCDLSETAMDEICRVGPLHGQTLYYLSVQEQSGMPQDYTVTVHP